MISPPICFLRWRACRASALLVFKRFGDDYVALVIGQLVVGLLLGSVAVSERAHFSELRSRVAGFCVLAASHLSDVDASRF